MRDTFDTALSDIEMNDEEEEALDQQKETILITYKSLIRSIYMNAAPIWFTNTSSFLAQKVQAVPNSALRVATGCVKMTSINHLHEETKMLHFHDHFSLISSQHLARTLQSNNPSHIIVTSPSGIRGMKKKQSNLDFSIVLPSTCRRYHSQL